MAITPTAPTPDRNYGFDKFETPVGSVNLSGEQGHQFWGEDGFSFADLIDLVNPLQPIPGVATIYREITGDEIAPGARMFGRTLLGGIPGVV